MTESSILEVLQEKLTFLQSEEVKTTEASAKYKLRKDIDEVKAKLAQLDGQQPSADKSEEAKCKVDISRIVKYAPSELIGREGEMSLLDEAWAKVRGGEHPRPHVFTFVALGGEGKTSVVAKWAAKLAGDNWPGCEAAFAWSFYSQGTRDQAAVSSEFFVNEALRFFGDPDMATSPQGAFEKGKRLAQLVGDRRALLILDGLEPLQQPPTSPTPGELKDKGISALLKELAGKSQGLCIVTTRYSVPDLRTYWQTTAHEDKLMRLSEPAGVSLLEKLGVAGPKEELACLVKDVEGHALTLQIMGAFLKRAYCGDIRRRDLVTLDTADAKTQGGHAFRAMAAYEKWMEGESDEARRELAILRLLGLFDRPATADCVAVLLQTPAIPRLTEPLIGLADHDLSFSIDGLESAKLITANRGHGSGQLIALDAHPLLREYFGQGLRDARPEAWKTGHLRLYKYLCSATKEGQEPTLEELQPLYQAVAHGCHAQVQQEAFDRVYRSRILRAENFYDAYSIKKLGAFGSDLGAVACFFETPWTRVSSELKEEDQAWLLNGAGFRLRALGRLDEALKPMDAALEVARHLEDSKHAARYARNLGELELTLGKVKEAVKHSEVAVIYADRSDDWFERMGEHAAHADALHQAGDRERAAECFRDAERIQAKFQRDHKVLYSLRGFRYCDLLLSEAEREASKLQRKVNRAPLLAACRVVAERATQTLRIAENNHELLEIALDHLTLGRAVLYSAILESRSHRPVPAPLGSPWPEPEGARSHLERAASQLDRAVSDLRLAGQQDHLPRGLLSRAWLRSLTGPRVGADSAQSDLDEAWEIAERGPMPLFLADIRLYRARLFFRAPQYPWESPRKDLAEARILIEQHGYRRREEELSAAEAAILEKQTLAHQ